MKNYIVRLKLIIGEYEKAAFHLVQADSDEAAGLEALKWESHCNTEGHSEDGHWWDDGYIYEVYSVRLVIDDADWSTLKDYLK